MYRRISKPIARKFAMTEYNGNPGLTLDLP